MLNKKKDTTGKTATYYVDNGQLIFVAPEKKAKTSLTVEDKIMCVRALSEYHNNKPIIRRIHPKGSLMGMPDANDFR